MEYGVVVPQGISYVRKTIPRLLEDASNELSVLFRELLHSLYHEMVHLDERITALEIQLKTLCDQDEDCQRLRTIPGVGLLSATAMVASIGDISTFSHGRELGLG